MIKNFLIFMLLISGVYGNEICKNGNIISFENFKKLTKNQNALIFYDLIPEHKQVEWIMIIGKNAQNSCITFDTSDTAAKNFNNFINSNIERFLSKKEYLQSYLNMLKEFDYEEYKNIVKYDPILNRPILEVYLRRAFKKTSNVSAIKKLEWIGLFDIGSGKGIFYK